MAIIPNLVSKKLLKLSVHGKAQTLTERHAEGAGVVIPLASTADYVFIGDENHGVVMVSLVLS